MTPADTSGDFLGHYRLDGKIGQGGMGVVYRAFDTRLNRMVAVKVLAPDLGARPKARERFLREARAAAALNHPNIVGIYEIGTDHDTDFIAMELVEGQTLAALLLSGPLPLPEALAYSSQIAAALAKAHAAGIVHRDLKPGNAMVNPDGLVKLVDFGLARIDLGSATGDDTPTDVSTESVLTGVGKVVGTFAYMSPEQVRGDLVDQRSDIFSFGVMLYEMLTGTRPFRASSTVAALHKIAYEEPRPLGELRAGLPPELVAVVRKCLEKDRAVRYQTIDPAAESLRGMLRLSESHSAAAQSAPLAAPSPRPRPGRRLAYLGAGLAALVAVVAASYPGQSLLRLFRNSPVAAAMHLPNAAAELCREGNAALLRFDRAGASDQAIGAFQKALEANHNSAAAYAGLAMAYAQKYRDNPDPSLRNLAEANSARALELNPLLADAHVGSGRVHFISGRYAEAEKALRRALELDPKNPDALLNLGTCLAARRQTKEAGETLGKEIAHYPDDWRGYHYLGALLSNSGRYDEAVPQLLRAGQLAPDNIAVAIILSATYVHMDRLDDAAAVLQKALAVQQTTLLLNNLGDVYFKAGRYADSSDAFRKALSKGANTHVIWANFGDALRFTPGHEKEARQAYQEASRLVEQQLRAAPDNTRLQASLALYRASAGEREAAGAALEGVRKAAKPDATTLFWGGLASELAGRRTDALRYFQDALAARYPLHEIENHPDLVALRQDPRYHLMVLARPAPKDSKP